MTDEAAKELARSIQALADSINNAVKLAQMGISSPIRVYGGTGGYRAGCAGGEGLSSPGGGGIG